jgi:uncharacterized C2H2 Zn-finger protein
VKIICEFCGNAVDIKEDDCCPACGASYKDNKDYQKKKELELERERLVNESKKVQLEQAKKTNNTNNARYTSVAQRNKNIGCAIYIVMAVLAVIILCFSVLMESLDDYQNNNDTYPSDQTEQTEQKPVETIPEKKPEFIVSSGNFNEIINAGSYTVKIDEAKEIDRYPFTPKPEHRYVAIHIVITNAYDEPMRLYNETDICIVDGIQKTGYWVKDYYAPSDHKIDPGVATEGWFVFEVPTEFMVMSVKLDNYVTINISMEDIIPMGEQE